MSEPRYTVERATWQPELQGLWDGPAWGKAPALEVACFRPESSDHRPRTECKLLYDSESLFSLFRVHDRFVRCVHTRFQDPVYKDSCVEIFLQPKTDAGYFNLEINCGGVLSASYIRDPTRRVGGAFRDAIPLTDGDARSIGCFHSLPRVVEPEIEGDTIWYVELSVRFALLERYVGALGPRGGQSWRANVYKCGDETSHPHWAAWAPVDAVDFHVPERFGTLRFA